ncbi:hypothetical protein CGZ80_01260 [Rhodopirellula sp. MGV]|nr:hypothetical protein CGZ80_17890 [Rhodopirellula sp. MGV]OYP38876.1 hypothetical protein CGZ80_01260 [Rhodopirellula sp. MGV]PNY37521.1 hypothetical protein C2E31_07255 [Rhodopirellula baltica]
MTNKVQCQSWLKAAVAAVRTAKHAVFINFAGAIPGLHLAITDTDSLAITFARIAHFPRRRAK